MRAEASIIVLGIALSSGCVNITGTLDPHGFRHNEFGYRVHGAPGAPATFVSADWQVDNFYRNGQARLVPTQGETVLHQFDVDGDGVVDGSVESQAFDLRLRHRTKSGVMWLRTFPISQTDRDRDLQALLQDSLGQANTPEAGMPRVVNPVLPTTQLPSYGAATLRFVESFDTADMAAVTALIDLQEANAGARPAAVARRMQVVLIRTNFQFRRGGLAKSTRTSFPVMMALGYASRTEEFAEGQAAFDGWIKAVEFESPPDGKPARGRRAVALRHRPEPNFRGNRLQLPPGLSERLLAAVSPDPASH